MMMKMKIMRKRLYLLLSFLVRNTHHLRQDQFAAGELGGVALREIPGRALVAAVSCLELVGAAIRFAGPEHGVGAELAARIILHEQVEFRTGLGELVGFEPALRAPEQHPLGPLVLRETVNKLLRDLGGG